jgi:hypothetical protein
MRGLLRSWSGLALASLTLGACADIIGISDYEIDPNLDEESGGASSAGQANGGTSPGGAAATDGGAPPEADGGEAGAQSMGASGGSRPSGGEAGQGWGGGSASAGEAAVGGESGSGPVDPGGCESALDCDDQIACTEDVCQPDGSCRSTADDSACDAFKCQTCQLGVGCVAGASRTEELLTDPDFDGSNQDWIETSDNFNDTNIFANNLAQTAPNIARFGPAPNNAVEQEYADLLQYVQIPERTVAVTLKGFFKLAPGTVLPEDDYTVAAIYELGETDPLVQFHSWRGDSAAQAAWKSFTYNAPKAKLLEMAGNEYTFDLVAYSWESVFQFDSLQLTATVCE